MLRWGGRLARGARAALLTVGLAAGGGIGAMAEASETVKFERWVADFSKRARVAGVDQRTIDAAFATVRYTPRVVELDSNQPEFSRPLWDYLDLLVSDARIENGRTAFKDTQEVLSSVETRYGVPAEVLTAFWGIESNFGRGRGDFAVIPALSTLAFAGRRRAFWEKQIIAALKIIERGDVGLSELKGSWAGAMGHTQFIPTSYLELAVDFDGDGKSNIWSDDPTDALASTANYMVRSGWRKGEPWGLQVTLPDGFDYAQAAAAARPTVEWTALGVTLSDGGPLPAYPGAKLMLPAGAAGPAFLTLANYRAIRRYNPSDAYALAVALLSERIAGRPPRTLAWPKEDLPLGRSERVELQEKLTELGYDTGGVDGMLGPKSQRAIRAFQRDNSMVADGYAAAKLLSQVRRALTARRSPLFAVAAGPAGEGDLREIQALLSGLGYDTGGVDGILGARTQGAIGAFIRRERLQIAAEPSQELLAALRQAVRGDPQP